jgi:tetratricopeptide (TPR) repeat protein
MSKGDNDRAIADAGEAIRLDPRNFAAYTNRARAYLNKGDNDRAIADNSEAIRLDPGNFAAYSNRAGDYVSKGDNDRAIADASEAIRLDPKSMPAYFSRGHANLYSGALPKALADLNQTSMLNPKDAYAALWFDIAGQRSNLPSRLLQAISRIDMTAWPAPVIQLFLGQLTPTAVLAATGNAGSGLRGQFLRRRICVAQGGHRRGDPPVPPRGEQLLKGLH